MVMRCKGTHRLGETHSQVGLPVPAESVLCGIWAFQVKHKVQDNDTDTQNLYGHRVGAGFPVDFDRGSLPRAVSPPCQAALKKKLSLRLVQEQINHYKYIHCTVNHLIQYQTLMFPRHPKSQHLSCSLLYQLQTGHYTCCLYKLHQTPLYVTCHNYKHDYLVQST